jgi:hypothetical protein
VWDTQLQQPPPLHHHHHSQLNPPPPPPTTNHAIARGHQHGLPAPLQVSVQGGKEAPALEPEAGRKRVLQGQQMCFHGAGQQHWFVHREGTEGRRREKVRKEEKRRGVSMLLFVRCCTSLCLHIVCMCGGGGVGGKERRSRGCAVSSCMSVAGLRTSAAYLVI